MVILQPVLREVILKKILKKNEKKKDEEREVQLFSVNKSSKAFEVLKGHWWVEKRWNRIARCTAQV